MHQTILVSAYLSGEEGARKLRYFEGVEAVLRDRGYRFLLLNTDPRAVKSSCDTLHLPAFIHRAHRLGLGRLIGKESLGVEVLNAASIDAAEWSRDPTGDAIRVLFYRAFLRDVIRRHTPALCIFWHQFNSLHDSMREFCAEEGVPMVYAEYGSLPGTIVFDAQGQMAESWIAQRNDEFLDLPVSEEDCDEASRFLEVLRSEKRNRKPGEASNSLGAILDKATHAERKVIFYAGQNDYKSGLAPRTHPSATVHSPFYESTNDALCDLCSMAEERNWQILFKPHPLAGHLVKDVKLPFPDRVDIVTGADIFECMEAAAVTVTLVSQVSYMALIHERPCVLLGRNQLSGKGCVYEADSRETAGDTVAVAIEEGFSAAQREAWIRHVAQLCTHALFAFDGETEAIIGRDAGESAAFLIEHASTREDGDRSGQSPSLFGGDLSEGKAARILARDYAWFQSLEPVTGPVVRLLGRFFRRS